MIQAAGSLRVAVDMTLLEGRTGGSATYATSLVAELQKRDDVDLQIISSGASGALRTAGWLIAGANRRARQVGATVLHCPAFLAPLSSPLPLVVTIHDLALGQMPQGHPLEWRMYYRVLVPRLSRRATLIITPTETTRAEVMSTFGVASERVVAIHSGIDQRWFAIPRQHRSNASNSVPLIVFPGPPIARKNLDLVLRAMGGAGAASALGQAHLAITGALASDHPGYARKIAEIGIASRVRWTGTLPFTELTALYASADLLVYPSFLEGFGFPPLEAMAVGTPVVASNASCLPEVLGDAALLVDPQDDVGFARAAESLLTDPSARNELVERGAARARRFTWFRAAEMTVDAYRRAAESVSGR